MTPCPLVVLDLFGVVAPLSSSAVWESASAQLAGVLGSSTDRVDAAFRDTWLIRQGGGCRTTREVAELLLRRVAAREVPVDEIGACLVSLATERIRPTPRLMHALERLRAAGCRLVLCSDAGPDVAEAWAATDWAPVFDQAFFSCATGRVKPDLEALRPVVAEAATSGPVLYLGDGGGGELAAARRIGAHPVRVAPPNRGRTGDDERIAGVVESLGTAPAPVGGRHG